MRLDQIRKKIKRIEIAVGRAILSELPQALAEHQQTGIIPAEPLFAAHLELQRAFDELVNQSIGGEQYAEALSAYETALSNYRAICEQHGLVLGG